MHQAKALVIAVHDGQFHADDVFAVAVLRRRFGNIAVIRTRDPAKLATADFRVDVGGRFAPEDGDFDHHQLGAPVRKNKYQTPYSAFGLVWQQFGPQMEDKEIVQIVDRSLVQAIDSEDCGIAPWRDTPGQKPATLDMVIEMCNPMWNELCELRDKEAATLVAFDNAVRMAEIILDRAIQRAVAEIEARVRVRQAMQNAADPRIVVMENDMPWQKTVIQEGKDVKFVVCRRSDGNWGARAVPLRQNGCELRCAFPESWAGKTDQELVAVSGVPDATFCHMARFIAIAKSRDGAVRLAQLALEAS
jgi:uncharacterized UPF0160 family protein